MNKRSRSPVRRGLRGEVGRRVQHGSVLLAVVLVLVGGFASAEEEGDLEVFTERLDVDVVNVEVHVTDSKGNPVRDLVAADFQLFEDGRPVPITNFYTVKSGRVQEEGAGDAEEAVEADAETSTETPATASPVDDQHRLHVVVFIDDFNTGPIQRKRVLNDLRPFLAEQLESDDRVMVVSFDGALEVVQTFTPDKGLAVTALDEISGRNGVRGAAAQVERQSILRDIADADLPVQPRPGTQSFNDALSIAQSEASLIYSSIQSYAQRHQNQTFVTLAALERMVNSLSGLQGRKVVVYVSEGLSLRPGETLLRAWENKFAAISPDLIGSLGVTSLELEVETAFQKVARHASDMGVTFYGLRPFVNFENLVETGTIDMGALDTAGGGLAWNTGLSSLDAANRGGTMRLLADVTGGFAITNAGRFRVALNRLKGDFDGYYSLGYTPPRPRDQKQHRIEVRVPGRKDLEVRHRTRYRDRTRGEQMRDRTLAKLVHGDGQNPLAVAVDVAEVKSVEGENPKLPVLVKVPLSNLALLPREDEFHGLVSIHVGARDDEGNTSPIRSVRVPIRIARADLPNAAGRMAAHRFFLEMYPRTHDVTVGVRDEVADVESFTVFRANPEL